MEVSLAPPSPLSVEAGGEQSLLRLPVIERGPGDYFEPPGQDTEDFATANDPS